MTGKIRRYTRKHLARTRAKDLAERAEDNSKPVLHLSRKQREQGKELDRMTKGTGDFGRLP